MSAGAPSVYVFPIDLSKVDEIEETCERWFSKTFHEGGKGFTLDLLVNNAGVSQRGPFLANNLASERYLMNLNFFAPVVLTRVSGSGLLSVRGQEVHDSAEERVAGRDFFNRGQARGPISILLLRVQRGDHPVLRLDSSGAALAWDFSQLDSSRVRQDPAFLQRNFRLGLPAIREERPEKRGRNGPEHLGATVHYRNSRESKRNNHRQPAKAGQIRRYGEEHHPLFPVLQNAHLGN